MDNPKESLDQITLAYDRGQAAVVVELCKKHLHKFPKDGFARLWYAMAQIDLARYGEAEKAIQQAIKLLPQNIAAIAYVQMGHLFKAKGDFKHAAF